MTFDKNNMNKRKTIILKQDELRGISSSIFLFNNLYYELIQ